MEMVMDDVPLSELQKSTILKDTSGVAQQSSKASDARTSSKSLTARNVFVSDIDVSKNVLSTSPPPHPSNTLSSPNSILSSPITPPSQSAFTLQSQNPNETPRKSHLRDSSDQCLFNLEPEHDVSDSDDVEQYSDLPSLVIPNVYDQTLTPTSLIFLLDILANLSLNNPMLVRF